MVLAPTVHGNGPFTPVVSVDGRLFVLGPQFDTILDALEEAQRAIASIRDSSRSDLAQEHMARLGV